jgi:rfaE bifunctional protein nucleotidyltransferase chain/domain
MWSELLNDKLYADASVLAKKVMQWQLYNEKVVFTNGCFDILHLGHIDYLSKAADLGDRLIIAVNTDESVRMLKGASRPIIDQHTRAMKLAAMTFVDAVILFGEETPLALITAIKPDVLAKGGDYTIETIVGAEHVIENGGSVQVIPFLEGNSTTAIINKIVG